MATKRVLSVRNNEALVKVEGAAGSVTIALATDLLGASEAISGTPTANLVGITWTTTTGTATISRNGVNIVSIPANSTGSLGPLQNFYDNGGNTFDLVVTTVTAEVQIWIKLHKVAGYQTMMQPEQFGSYDNTTSTTS